MLPISSRQPKAGLVPVSADEVQEEALLPRVDAKIKAFCRSPLAPRRKKLFVGFVCLIAWNQLFPVQYPGSDSPVWTLCMFKNMRLPRSLIWVRCLVGKKKTSQRWRCANRTSKLSDDVFICVCVHECARLSSGSLHVWVLDCLRIYTHTSFIALNDPPERAMKEEEYGGE